MEEEGEKNEKVTSPLQIDPKWYVQHYTGYWSLNGCSTQDAPKGFPQPANYRDPRLEFYTIYQKVATKYDADYHKTRNADLNVMLILVCPMCLLSVPHLTCSQAGLLSAVSTAFIIDINSKIDSSVEDPIRALKELSLIPMAATAMYLSLGSTLASTLLTIGEKEFLKRLSLSTGGLTVIEWGRYRQRNCDRRRRFRSRFSTSPLVAIVLALSFVIGGVCGRAMYTFHSRGLCMAIIIPLLGIASYYYALFTIHRPSNPLTQIRVFVALCRQWPRKEALYRAWHFVLCQIYHVLLWLPRVEIGRRSHNQSLPTVQPAPQDHTPSPTTQDISPNPRVTPEPPDQISCPTIRGPVTAPLWFTPSMYRNVDDAKCVLWVLRYIADPEALNAAIRFSAMIRWYEDGLDTEDIQGLITSILDDCFDSQVDGVISPGRQERACESTYAAVWILICRECAPEKSAAFSQPTIPRDTTRLDRNIGRLLRVQPLPGPYAFLKWAYHTGLELGPEKIRWVSNALLHMSWVCRGVPEAFDSITKESNWGDWSIVPQDAAFNRLLTWCIFLGWRVDMDALRPWGKWCVISYPQPTSFLRCCSQ